MSDLFHVCVLDIRDRTIDVRLVIDHPNEHWFYTGKAFALQLIHHGGDSLSTTPRPIDRDLPRSLGDSVNHITYVCDHVAEYIESAAYLGTRNYPEEVDQEHFTDEEFEAYWADEEKRPQAVLRIVVTDSAWLQHLHVGMEWGTTAYDIEGYSYNPSPLNRSLTLEESIPDTMIARSLRALQSDLLRLRAAGHDVRFNFSYPCHDADIPALVAQLQATDDPDDLEVHLYEPLVDLDRASQGITFECAYGNEHDGHVGVGFANIASLFAIYMPWDERDWSFELLYERYILFDRLRQGNILDNSVSLRFRRGVAAPDLCYYALRTNSYYRMRIGVEEYIHLLRETLGLYSWQQFFLADPFPHDVGARDAFVARLSRVRPDVDLALFRI